MAATVDSFTPTTSITALDEVSFRVSTYDVVLVAIEFPSIGITELAYDGADFTPAYKRNGSIVVTGGGDVFHLLREPAWPDAPKVRVFAVTGSIA